MTPEEAREHVKAVADRWQKRGEMSPIPSLDEEMAVYVAVAYLLGADQAPYEVSKALLERIERLERQIENLLILRGEKGTT